MALRALIGCGLIWLSYAVLAQPAAFAQAPELRGSLTSRFAGELNGGDTQLAEILFEPELSGSWGANVSYTLIGRARFDAVDELEPGKPGAQAGARSAWNRRVFEGDDTDFELREAYADIYAGDWFVRAGKQQVVWGQADGLRVLDQVNPLSFREFILGDFEDRRIPLWMLNIERPIGSVTAQFLWIPDTTYNEFPQQGAFAITSTRSRPEIPATAQTVTVNPARRPERMLADSDIGLRLSGFSGGWDWSVNALYAFHDTPVAKRQTIAPGHVGITPTYYRSTLLGGSASNAFGKLTLRTEIGYQSRSAVLTRDASDADGVVISPEVSGVVGLDYQLDADTLLSTQVFASHRTRHGPKLATDRTSSTISLLGSREFYNDQLKLQFLLLQNFNDGDGLLQVSAQRNLTDAVTLQLGADIFHGDRNAFYGQFDDRDRVWVAFEYGF
jgi:hypothetical protein